MPYYTFRLEGRRISNIHLSEGNCAPVKHNRTGIEEGESELEYTWSTTATFELSRKNKKARHFFVSTYRQKETEIVYLKFIILLSYSNFKNTIPGICLNITYRNVLIWKALQIKNIHQSVI
jgi:hypothetical protein